VRLDVFSDLSERVKYNMPNFPIHACKSALGDFHAVCHWHPDLEFFLVTHGIVNYSVNGKNVCVREGEGIFVNSRRLHYAYSKDNAACRFVVAVIHPSLLCNENPVSKNYFESKFGTETEDYILLTNSIDWHIEAQKSVAIINEELNSDKKMRNPMLLISQITLLCANIGEHIGCSTSPHFYSREREAIQKMVGFIHKNYENSITLADIAAAGSVCRSKCCKFFNEFIGETPNVFLTRYRIAKSNEMLKETDMPVYEIAYACGFYNQSYFTQVFRKELGMTPKECRNKARQIAVLTPSHAT